MHIRRTVESERDDDIESLLPSLPELSHPLARELASALNGAVYPLSRGELVTIARENEAPAMLVTLLAGLPQRLYHSEAEVTEVVDEARPRTP